MSKTRVLTGITTTGTPHLGNYVGAIRPAVAASRESGRREPSSSWPTTTRSSSATTRPASSRSRLEIAATWLAAGLDPERVTFYRPERHPRDSPS
ncbi:MAG: hypothetical protein LKM39_11210 [Chiayiivirga sp.]|jgi:tryptophanyl-tRNA synthetase|nr:hypothetical protein [Chiayiivirga sp.]